MKNKNTIDDFLDGELIISQPKQGFRAGSDAVLLAAIANECSGKVLDIGCGVGVASLCFSHHNRKSSIIAVDIQDDLLELACDNIKNNNCKNIEVKKIDVYKDKPEYQSFNTVITNPPFFKEGHGIKSPSAIKQKANTGTMDLNRWIDFCFLSLKDKGDFTIIFTADRLSELLSEMHDKFGDINIIPLYPKLGQDAKRVIIKAKKNTKGITKLTSGIILHKDNGDCNIEKILRKGERYDI